MRAHFLRNRLFDFIVYYQWHPTEKLHSMEIMGIVMYEASVSDVHQERGQSISGIPQLPAMLTTSLCLLNFTRWIRG